MKTGNFKKYKGINGIAICLFPPASWNGNHDLRLAPTKKIFYDKKNGKIDEKEYESLYRSEVLSNLDPLNIYNEYKDKVLLCWEDEGQFCHRFIVGKWIYEELGVKINEWKKGDDDPKHKTGPLF